MLTIRLPEGTRLSNISTVCHAFGLAAVEEDGSNVIVHTNEPLASSARMLATIMSGPYIISSCEDNPRALQITELDPSSAPA